MRTELDQALCAAYPLIFKDRHGDMRSTLMCWGFDCGDGWYDLLRSTCDLLYAPYVYARESYNFARKNEGAALYQGGPVISAVDVERKRLLMSAAADALPIAAQVKEKFGALRFYVHNSDERADAILDFAQHHSSRVCDECGSPGTLREGRWLRTLCDTHAR